MFTGQRQNLLQQNDPSIEGANETKNNNVNGEVRQATINQKISQFITNRKWLNSFRSLPEFLSPVQFSLPKLNEIWNRLEYNVPHFLTNYILIILIIMSFTILTKPWLFCGILIIGYIWTLASSRDSITIGSFKVENNRKFGVLCLLTVGAMLFLGFHETIMVSFAIGSILSSIHAIFHKIPDNIVDEENDFDILGNNVLNNI